MSRPPKQTKKKLISVGSLKLEKRDADEFLESLEFYGIDSIANILRQCALAISRHRKRGESIKLPLTFQINGGPQGGAAFSTSRVAPARSSSHQLPAREAGPV